MTKRKLGSEKVREGKAKIPLKIEDPDYANGEYPLDIKYIENKYYEGSDAFGSLWHVYKTFIHCPTIYVHRGIEETAKLTANLFSNNNLLNEGKGNFTVEKVTLKNKINVTNGSAFYDYSLKKYQKTNIPFFLYGFIYDGIDEHYREPARYNNARVIFVEYDPNKIPISIQTYPVMGAKGDTVKLIARVYKTINAGTIDPPKDIPDNGYLLWYVNNRYIGKTDFWESGYATLDYKIIENIGVYEYRVEYIPTNTKHYNTGYGANTLCVLPKSPNIIHATANIPTTSLGSTISFNITLDKTQCIDGLRLYIDDQLVSIMGTSTDNNHTKNVDNTTVNVSFAIPETVSPSKRWAVEGTHAVFWEYTDTCTGITHYQYLDDLLILFPSTIDFDYIARNTDSPYNTRIYNELNGIPIVTPEILGHIFNKKYPNKEVDDGKLTLDLEKMPTHISQSVNMIHVSPTVDETRYEVDDKANTNSVLYSNKNMGIPGRNVYLEILNPNNVTSNQNSTTDIDGKINLNTSLNMAGTWKITTKYDGHKYEYNSKSTTKTLTAYKKETILTLQQDTTDTIYVDDTVSYTATLKCKDTPLSNQTLKVTIGTKQYTPTTNEEGKITISYKHTESGNIPVKVEYEENRKYLSSTKQLTTKVNKLNVIITAENISGIVGDELVEIGTVKDQRGNNVPGQVIITQNNQSSNCLIKNGQFTYTHTPLTVGTNTYTITFDETYKYNQASKTYKVTARKLQTTITSQNQEIFLGETVTIPITLLDENNNIPTRGTITLLSGTTQLNYINLPKNKLQFPLTPTSKGTYTYKIDYTDDFRYEPSSTNTTIKVKTLNTSISIPNKTVYVDNEAKFTISLTDENNNKPSSGTITIKQGNNTIKTIDINQIMEFELPTDTSGTKTYTAIYEGPSKYETSQTTFKLTINKRPVNIELELSPINTTYRLSMSSSSEIIVTDTSTNEKIHEGILNIYLKREKQSGNSYTTLIDYMKVGELDLSSNLLNDNILLYRTRLLLDDFLEANKEQNLLIYSGYRLKAEYMGTNKFASKTVESDYGKQELTVSNARLEAKTIIDDDSELKINKTITSLAQDDEHDFIINKSNYTDNKTINVGTIHKGQTFYLAMDIRAKHIPDANDIDYIELCDTIGGVGYDVHMILDADVARDTDESILAGEEVDGIGTVISKSGFRYGNTISFWKFTVPDVQHWENVHQIQFVVYTGKNSNLFSFGEDYGMKFTLVLNVEDS